MIEISWGDLLVMVGAMVSMWCCGFCIGRAPKSGQDGQSGQDGDGTIITVSVDAVELLKIGDRVRTKEGSVWRVVQIDRNGCTLTRVSGADGEK